MAKNCNILSIRSNMVEENRKILNELRNQRQVYNYNEDDLNKLCEKLNLKIGSKEQNNPSNSRSSLYNKQELDYIYGPIQRFPPGSWWGIRMDCARDLVHNSFDSDIQIGPAGATSVCTSQANIKGDIDLGDYLTLTGQRFSEGAANDDPLILNYKNQVPVRLIRSYNLSNPFAPRTGYRYDGLYAVIAYWIGINSDSTKHNKFALMRLPGQEPSAWQRNKDSDFMTVLKPTNVHCSLSDAQKYKNYMCDPDIFEKHKRNLCKDSKQFIARNAKIAEQPKNTRHTVVVKSHNEIDGPNTVNNACVPNENSSHFSIHESKAQNTNISIRTDLYDSSHNIQPDVKKNTLLLSKTLKTTLPHRRIAQHPESIGISKANNVNKSSVKTDSSENNTVPEIGNNADGQESIQHYNQNNNIADSGLSAVTDQSKCTEFKKLTRKRACSGESYTVQFSKRACHLPSSSKSLSNEEQNNTPDNCEKLIPILPKSTRNQKSLLSLDSLTPDEILNLIDKEKCHPLSQFLIDSMIGLKPEESLKLRSCNSIRSPNNTKINISVAKNCTEGEASTKYAVQDRCKLNRHNKCSDLSGKTTDKSRAEKYRRILRNKSTKNSKLMEKKHNSSTDNASAIVQKSKRVYKKHNSTNNSSSHRESNGVISSSNVNVLNNKSRATLNDKQNSKYRARTTIQVRKNVKNVDTLKHRKQRREITNLIIDAKITPLARGPRNRRLRSIGNSCGKKRYYDNSFKSFFCSTEKRKISMKKSSCKADFRKKSKLSKSSDCLKRMRRRQSTAYRSTVSMNSRSIRGLEALGVQMVKKHKNVDHQSTDTPANNQHNITLRSSNSTDTRGLRSRKVSPDKNSQEGRKHAIPVESSCCVNKWNRVCCLHNKQNIVKPSAADAMVQCSFPNEFENESLQKKNTEANSLNDTNDPKIIFKMEKTSSEETYSELLENKCQMNSALRMSTNSEKVEESSSKRPSAFVPVGTFDSHLRIARLRSLGFKPIGASAVDEEDVSSVENNVENESENGSRSKKVVERDAQEVYSKYSNEDGSLVGYLDEDLSYQDIEDEVVGKCMISVSVGDECGNSTETLKYKTAASRESRDAIEHDLDLPWHGWKKVVTNEQSFWVGW